MIWCIGCDELIAQDDQNIWRPPGGRASCRRGGPHRPRIEDVKVDWSSFDSTLTEWEDGA